MRVYLYTCLITRRSRNEIFMLIQWNIIILNRDLGMHRYTARENDEFETPESPPPPLHSAQVTTRAANSAL